MASVFSDFRNAQMTGSGPMLAAAITPVAPPEDPDRLRSFYHSTPNDANAACDLRYALLQDKTRGVKLPKQEGNTWVDIFCAFWKATGEIVKMEESPPEGSWTKVFEAWKEVANLLIRGYSTGILQAWTVPCLYAVGKYLRAFAINADAETSQDSLTFGDGFLDDFASNVEKNAKLEDAARTINRMFTLCLSDRYVLVSACSLPLLIPMLINPWLGRPWMNQENGASTIQPIFYLRPTSGYGR